MLRQNVWLNNQIALLLMLKKKEFSC